MARRPASPLLYTVPLGPAPPAAGQIVPLAVAVDAARRRVFVSNAYDDVLRVLDADDGATLRATVVRLSSGPVVPSTLAVDARRGWIYAVGGGPSLIVLDARTGAVPRAVPVGVSPYAIAVDEATGRVFVADSGGAEQPPDPWAWVPREMRRRLPFLPATGPPARVVPPRLLALDVARL